MDSKHYPIVSMDMSMRSSGLVALNTDGVVIGQKVIKTSKDEFPDTEDLIIHVRHETIAFCELVSSTNWGFKFVIEGLAFAGKSGHKDILAGIYWGIRAAIRQRWPDVLIGSIPVTTWRKTVLSPAEQREAKKTLSPKAEAVKKATVAKLPADVKPGFLQYIEAADIDEKSIYDLTDAYFMGIFRIGLDNA